MGFVDNAIVIIIYVYGNVGNMFVYWLLVSWLFECNFNVFMFDYCGFGKLKGMLFQVGLLDDM